MTTELMERLTQVQAAVNTVGHSMLGIVTDEGDLLSIDDTIVASLAVVERLARLVAELRRLREMVTAGQR
jgi:hypothetical protein